MVFVREVKWNGEDSVSIIDLHGNHVGHYSALDLARDWLVKSNDDFYNLYGFDWDPPLELLDKARIAFSL